MNLFNRAAIFTDLHVGLKSNSEIHNKDCEAFVDWFISEAKKEKCETCLFLGDWHHHRASININSLSYSIRLIEKLSEAFDSVFMIPGNHDHYYRNNRDVHSVEWAKHLPNVRIINDWFQQGDVTIAPWLVQDDWKRLQKLGGKYLFGHFELPHFKMNAMVEMPDHGELQTTHLVGYERVFSGHFHKRQEKGNVIYIGNAFPHNYSDVDDDSRGMTILDWSGELSYRSWPAQPRFRVYQLSDVLERTEELLQPNMYVRVNLDIDISYEEANFVKEQLIPQYNLRELTLIPVKHNIEDDATDYGDMKFESVDSIIINQIGQLEEGMFDRALLLDIYRNL